MSYSRFTGVDLKEKFGLEKVYRRGLVTHLPPRPASPWLVELLRISIPFALAQQSEKARSEYIIAPVFLDLREQTGQRISVFSGVRFNVDKKQWLDGWCDFLISRSSYQGVLEAPVVVAVEAKRQDFDQGSNQCIAEMVAARIYNQRRNLDHIDIYGCVTTGDAWRFIILRGSEAVIETTVFSITQNLDRIMGILWAAALGEVSDIQ